MKFSVVFSAVFLIGAAAAGAPDSTKAIAVLEKFDNSNSEYDNYAVINDLADALIELVRNAIIYQGYDPMKLPDIHKGFSFRILLVNYHGELDLNKGWLQDASTLYRGGDVTFEGLRDITVEIPINWNDFLFDYNYSAKLMGIGPTGKIDGKVNDIQVFCSLTVNSKNLFITLNQFEVVNIGKIDLNFHGNTLTDWLANIMSDVITWIFKGLIVDIAENVIGEQMQAVIDQINSITQK